MTLLVFGRTGQLALELRRLRPDAMFLGRDDADLSNPAACADAIRRLSPTAVINAAAYTAVDRAESEPDLANAVNGHAPGAMAVVAAGMDIPFVHVSTDYVFNGTGVRPWQPSDAVDPINAYGASKALGEARIIDAGGRFAILRASWVFSAHGSNFVKTMLRLSETRDRLQIVDDQIGGPTPAADLAAVCLAAAKRLQQDSSRVGVYHVSGAPDVSWKQFAEAIFENAGRSVAVSGIPSADYPTPARRPLNSRLDCRATQAAFGLARPDWRAGLQAVLAELGAKS